MKTMFNSDFSLSDILHITRHVKDKPDLSPLWAPSDFSLEKKGKMQLPTV
jgi:hypothetical protein